MIEAFRVSQPENGQYTKPKRLRKFNMDGVPTVVVTKHENLEVIIGNDNKDGTTSVISIYIDNNHYETFMLEYEMIKKLRFGNQGNNTSANMQHIYDKSCSQCINGDGHVIRIDDIALGEPNLNRLRFIPWNIFLNKIGNVNNETISRFEE